MKITNLGNITNNVSTAISVLKSSLDRTMKPWTTKKDTKISGFIYPLVSVHDCKIVTNNYPMLNAILRVLASDIILNEFNFVINDDPYLNFETADQFWINNKRELCLAVEQLLGYGYSACEILLDKDTGVTPVKLQQIPSETLRIKTLEFNEKKYHYAYFEWQTTHKLFRITREDYDDITPQEDGSCGYVIWLGGGTESQWYDKPYWTSCYLDIMTALTKKDLDYSKLQEGNIPDGIVFIKAPPDNTQEGESTRYKELKRSFKNSKGGVAIHYFESPMSQDNFTADYIKLAGENYEYLNQLVDKTDNLVLIAYRVPKIRLAIDEGTESINSQKSETMYEIYTLDLNTYQYPIEQEVDMFNQLFFQIDTSCDIKTPVFADTQETKVNTIIALFREGIITLKQSIQIIATLYPDYDWGDVDFNDPDIYNRYYHGMIFATQDMEQTMDGFLMQNMRGGYADEIGYNPNATPEEQHLPASTGLFN